MSSQSEEKVSLKVRLPDESGADEEDIDGDSGLPQTPQSEEKLPHWLARLYVPGFPGPGGGR